jgi:hypothetical protein
VPLYSAIEEALMVFIYGCPLPTQAAISFSLTHYPASLQSDFPATQH